MAPTMPQRLARRVIYENDWVNLYVDRVEFPGGRIVEEHHLLEFGREAVAALVTREDGALLLVEAYRYATGSIGWEVPAGGIDHGEEILQAAEREVLEESGYATAEHLLVYSYYPINGISNHLFHIVQCQARELSGVFDRNEVRSTAWFTPGQLQEMIDRQQIQDGHTLPAVLWYLRAG